MAWIPVTSYYLRYNLKEKQCVVGVHYREGGSSEGRMLSKHFLIPANEAPFLVDLLRNEKPVYFDPESGAIATGKETVGEGEIASA
jgi:hypothetical protein